MKLRSTSLIGWLGIPMWVIVAAVMLALILPAIKISVSQPLKIHIQIGGN
ncbi:MAG: hypothetical protein ACM37W_22995 [Actinomycetota bacterium]